MSTAFEEEPEWHSQRQPQQLSHQQQQQKLGFFAAAVLAVRQHLFKLDGLWGKFIPMAGLFFLMAFVNTIIDSLKDSLVITAVGGGTHVIPYLTGGWPAACWLACRLHACGACVRRGRAGG